LPIAFPIILTIMNLEGIAVVVCSDAEYFAPYMDAAGSYVSGVFALGCNPQFEGTVNSIR
jgi:hypothetical protein